jgi:hypothetical protein
LRRGLVALAICLPLLYVLLTYAVVVQDRRSTLSQAESDMRNIASTLSEHALRTFGEADTHLRAAIADIERRGLSLEPADERSLHEILVAAMEGAPQAAALNILDPAESGPSRWRAGSTSPTAR